MLAAVTAINGRISPLAPVLNGPTVEGGASVTSSAADVPIDLMVKRHDGATYVFAACMRDSATTGGFDVADLAVSETAEVLDEGREIQVTNGQFTDGFQPYEVHLYRITDPSIEQPVLTTIAVTPATATIPTGGSRLFTAAPLDQFGAPFAALVSWDVVGGGGTMSDATGPNSTFNSDGFSTGTFTITASSSGIDGTATVTVEARVLGAVTVNPRAKEIVVLEDQVFNAVTLDQFGAPIAATVSWDVDGGGTLSDLTGPTTTFTSGGTLGEFTITATSGGFSDQVTVTVLEGPPYLATGPGCLPCAGAGLRLAAAMLAAALIRRSR